MPETTEVHNLLENRREVGVRQGFVGPKKGFGHYSKDEI